MRRREPRENRKRLEHHVDRKARPTREDGRRRGVRLVPRREPGDDDTGVDGDQRLDPSIVSRTIASVSGGKASRGTATAPPFRLTRAMGVAAAWVRGFVTLAQNQRFAGGESQPLAYRLRDHDTACTIDGSIHGRNIPSGTRATSRPRARRPRRLLSTHEARLITVSIFLRTLCPSADSTISAPTERRRRDDGNHLATVAVLLSLSGTALATFRTVTSADDNGAGTLRQAVLDSVNGDFITFDSSLLGQTITLTSGELVVSATVQILASTGRITVSGGHTSRVLHIAPGATVLVTGLTIRDGLSTSGGGIYNQGALALADVTVTENRSPAAAAGGSATTRA